MDKFNFTPLRETQRGRMTALRDIMRLTNNYINDLCPDGREKDIAMVKLEECVMWANKSISLENESD